MMGYRPVYTEDPKTLSEHAMLAFTTWWAEIMNGGIQQFWQHCVEGQPDEVIWPLTKNLLQLHSNQMLMNSHSAALAFDVNQIEQIFAMLEDYEQAWNGEPDEEYDHPAIKECDAFDRRAYKIFDDRYFWTTLDTVIGTTAHEEK